jgi:hypothetical protein
MVIKRSIPEFGLEIVCDGLTLKVLAEDGQVIEEHEVSAPTYIEISGELEKAEEALLDAARGMETP